MVDDYMAGKIPLDALITETIALDDINKAFDNMHTGKGFGTNLEIFSLFNLLY
jgi:Zn-dependent alcohol dehydrogenase